MNKDLEVVKLFGYLMSISKSILEAIMYYGTVILAVIVGLFGTPCFAIDNPDAPNRVVEFENRMSVHEQNIAAAKTTLEYIERYTAYEKALDGELNDAYGLLMSKLGEDTRQLLRESQREWIKYRDKEYKFIVGNWTRKSFGSSFVISRGDYKTRVVRERVIQLLNYSMNYL